MLIASHRALARRVRMFAFAASALASACSDPSEDAPADPDAAAGAGGDESAQRSRELEQPSEPADPTATLDPLTDLSLVLLATMAGDEPGNGVVTLRDEDAGVIATYHVGDPVRSGVVVTEISAEHVVLARDGRRERLEFDVHPVELDAADVFYSDLADPDDWPNSMADAVQLAAGFGYEIKRPNNAWGTPRTVHTLREAIRAYHRDHSDSPSVHVGDLSKKDGGPFPPHVSHRDGRDVDIGYVLKGAQAHQLRFARATRVNLDRARSWGLLRALLKNGAVGYVFMDYDVQRLLYDHARSVGEDPTWLAEVFQYPRGPGAYSGIVRHWPGHDDHFHIRVRQ